MPSPSFYPSIRYWKWHLPLFTALHSIGNLCLTIHRTLGQGCFSCCNYSLFLVRNLTYFYLQVNIQYGSFNNYRHLYLAATGHSSQRAACSSWLCSHHHLSAFFDYLLFSYCFFLWGLFSSCYIADLMEVCHFIYFTFCFYPSYLVTSMPHLD